MSEFWYKLPVLEIEKVFGSMAALQGNIPGSAAGAAISEACYKALHL